MYEIDQVDNDTVIRGKYVSVIMCKGGQLSGRVCQFLVVVAGSEPPLYEEMTG